MSTYSRMNENVEIEYWQQDTMESGRWVKTKPMPRATAEKVVDSFPRGEIVDVKQGVAEGSEQRLPIVMYKEISPDWLQGEDLYQVVQSQSPFWKVGKTFSDDDISKSRQQVRFISDFGKEHGVAEG